MIFEFKSDTIYDTFGRMIQASKQCRNSKRPKNVRNRIYFKLYDSKGNLVSEYYTSTENWTKSILKDMYRKQRGTLESVCSPHPY